MHTIPYPVFCGFVLLAYFLPTITAFIREHRRLGWICLANILVGWTIVGWALVAMWAMSSRRHRHHNKRKKRAARETSDMEVVHTDTDETPRQSAAVIAARLAVRRDLILPTGGSIAEPFCPTLDDEFTPQWRHFSPQSVTEVD